MYLTNLYIETRIKGIRRATGWYGFCLECIDGKGTPHTILKYDQVENITPNQLVLTAMCAALEKLKDNTEIIVYIESQYVKDGYTRWLKSWSDNNWRLANGEPVKNMDLWKRIEVLTRYKAVSFAGSSRHSYKNLMQYELQKRSKNVL